MLFLYMLKLFISLSCLTYEILILKQTVRTCPMIQNVLFNNIIKIYYRLRKEMIFIL